MENAAICLYRNKSSAHWYSIDLELWHEVAEPGAGRGAKQYQRKEALRLHLSKDMKSYHLCDFAHECGENGSLASFARDRIEFATNARKQEYQPVRLADFLRLRLVVLRLYSEAQNRPLPYGFYQDAYDPHKAPVNTRQIDKHLLTPPTSN